MELKSITYQEFNRNAITTFAEEWFLLTAGDMDSGDWNTMTIAWGGLGMMWAKPVVWAPVRKSRHTEQFMKKYDSFTLCGFPKQYKDALQLCGTKSGRDTDKLKETGLTLKAATTVGSPVFEEADLVIECSKLYANVVTPELFTAPEVCEKNYPKKDYHTIYIGEIMAMQSAR